jgi:hypothetical protein
MKPPMLMATRLPPQDDRLRFVFHLPDSDRIMAIKWIHDEECLRKCVIDLSSACEDVRSYVPAELNYLVDEYVVIVGDVLRRGRGPTFDNAARNLARFPRQAELQFELCYERDPADVPGVESSIRVRVYNVDEHKYRIGNCRSACLALLQCMAQRRGSRAPLLWDLRMLVAQTLWKTRLTDEWTY